MCMEANVGLWLLLGVQRRKETQGGAIENGKGNSGETGKKKALSPTSLEWTTHNISVMQPSQLHGMK